MERLASCDHHSGDVHLLVVELPFCWGLILVGEYECDETESYHSYFDYVGNVMDDPHLTDWLISAKSQAIISEIPLLLEPTEVEVELVRQAVLESDWAVYLLES
jgi:hypothetical protein